MSVCVCVYLKTHVLILYIILVHHTIHHILSRALIFYILYSIPPVAVFNQSMYLYGLDPLVPNEVGLIYPKTNNMLLFKGNRYHGVMHVC